MPGPGGGPRRGGFGEGIGGPGGGKFLFYFLKTHLVQSFGAIGHSKASVSSRTGSSLYVESHSCSSKTSL